jgi:hypothetical protein
MMRKPFVKKNKIILLMFMFSSMLLILMGGLDNSNIKLGEIDSVSNEFGSPIVKSSGNSSIFNGLIINGTFDSGGGPGPSIVYYNYDSGNTFNVTWIAGTWQENNLTRIMTGVPAPFVEGTNAFFWIFTNTSLSDTIPISVLVDGDHNFNVTGETTHNYPGYGALNVWILQDLDGNGGIVNYEKSTGIMMNGTFTFMGGAGTYWFTFNDTNANFPGNDYAPELTLGSANPTQGNQTTQFNFTVTYTDQDNNAPLYVNTLLNGTVYPMSKQNVSDDNYTDGCVYEFETFLQAGLYNYSFETDDGRFSNSTQVYFWVNVTSIPNTNSPTLTNGQVNPNWGFNSTSIFTFTVNYTDADNNPPTFVNITINSTMNSMTKQNPGDLNYIDGCIYEYKTNLTNFGLYQYYFNSSDGLYNASSVFYQGPKVIRFILFDGMFVNYTFKYLTMDNTTQFLYNYYNGTLFNVTWTITGSNLTWNIDQETRLISNAMMFSPYANGDHSPVFIFNETTINDIIPISIIQEPERTFQVVGERYFNLTGFGVVEAWVLEDLTYPGYYANFEKSTGILINGSFNILGGTDQYYYGFNTTNANFTYAFNSLAPELTSANVTPVKGNQTTLFTFTVNYSDQDNNFPDYVSVLINGTKNIMKKQDISDIDYTDGCIYEFSTYLQPGLYNYSFETADWQYTNSTPVYFWVNVTSTGNFNSPTLQDGQVNPTSGFINSTQYIFTVNYTDIDNNPPLEVNITINGTTYIMTKQNPLDSNYMDGCIYVYSRIFTQGGVYTYFFNSSDGVYNASDGPFSDLNIANQLPWDLVRLDGVRIGMILSHGETNPITKYPTIISYLEYRGAILSNVTVALDSTVLSNYDVIWFEEGGGVIPVGELDAIEQWVYEGGSYIITGDSFVSAENLANRFNVSFLATFQTGLTSDINPHPITNDVSQIFISLTSLYLDLSAQPNANSCVEINSLDIAAAMEFGDGSWVMIMMDLQLGMVNNELLYNNTFGWLGFEINDYAPVLSSGSLAPISGNQSTLFNFTVIYTDQDDNSPNYVNLILNSTVYPMYKQNSSDLDYTDGCIYEYTTFLTVDPYNYTFYFNTTDGIYSNSTTNYTGPLVTYVNDFVPQLLSPQVSPTLGSNTTIFNFTVWYYDADNNMPVNINITIPGGSTYNMTESNPADVNAIDGKEYSYTTSLTYGLHQFQINCSDPDYYNGTAWIGGPEVNPFWGLENITIFEDDFESGTGKWTINGFWHLTGSSSAWPNSFRSFNQSMWFGQEGTGDYDSGFREMGNITSDPFDLSGESEAILEFYHWRVVEEFGGFDVSRVFISNDGATWYTIYQDDMNVGLPWQREIINISTWCGNNSVQIMFHFDTVDTFGNNFRGWLVDDVKIYTNGTAPPISLLLPGNGTEISPGLNNFSWASMEPSFDSINYTLQISSDVNFTSILYEENNIPETPTTTNTSIIISFPTGIYYWRVCGTYNGVNGSWSDPFWFNLTGNVFAPVLFLEWVDPFSGNQLTQFNFTVIYLDLDNNGPSFMNVTINGTSYVMVKQNAGDNNYTDGCLYQYLTYLAPDPFNYTYFYNCSDGDYYNWTFSYSDVEVIEVNNYVPYFLTPLVSPTIGNGTTMFYFTVWYYDDDNNLPLNMNITISGVSTYNMTKAIPADTNALDGILYYYNTTLPFGYYQFQVNGSDKDFYNGTGWIGGPEVNPFYNYSNIVNLLTPIDSSTKFSGILNFTWSSLNGPFGAVNYTWQLSNLINFSVILLENTSIAERPGVSNLTRQISIPSGQYFWRVRATYGPFNHTWSGNFTLNITLNDNAPTLTGGTV